MNKIQLTLTAFMVLTFVASIYLASCSSAKKITIPVSSNVSFEDTYTIIWNGYSKAFVYKEGSWLRAETFDYYFDVIQKRYSKEWKSVKSLHRIHPDYNGKAGGRDQTMYFGVNYHSIQNSIVAGDIHSSLGEGKLITDSEFRNSEMFIDLKGANKFLPYSKIKITQHYDYEKGKLSETVELLKERNGQDIPFMKNEEEAYFYIKGKLDAAPTKFEQAK